MEGGKVNIKCEFNGEHIILIILTLRDMKTVRIENEYNTGMDNYLSDGPFARIPFVALYYNL